MKYLDKFDSSLQAVLCNDFSQATARARWTKLIKGVEYFPASQGSPAQAFELIEEAFDLVAFPLGIGLGLRAVTVLRRRRMDPQWQAIGINDRIDQQPVVDPDALVPD